MLILLKSLCDRWWKSTHFLGKHASTVDEILEEVRSQNGHDMPTCVNFDMNIPSFATNPGYWPVNIRYTGIDCLISPAMVFM